MENYKKDFPWFKKNKGVIYLDSGATSLKPQCVIDAVNQYMIDESYNAHNTDSLHVYKTTQKINDTKKKLAAFLNTDIENIIFTPGATFSINMIAYGIKHLIKPGDEILLNTLEHASNLLPWFQLAKETGAVIKYLDTEELFLDEKTILQGITNKTRIIAFANGTNLIGGQLDAESISKKIKTINPQTIICIDATQYIPLNKMDLKNSAIDFLACSGHKMCAPTGIGIIYVKLDMKKDFRPSIFGGGMNKTIRKEEFEAMESNAKYEAGTLNIMGIYGWNAAIDYLNTIDLKAKKEELKAIKKYLEEEIDKIADFEVINKGVDSYIVIFKNKNVFGQDFANYLGKNDIIVRSGLSCAKLAHHNTNESNIVRASLYLYSDYDDANRLLEVLRKYKKGEELNWI
ncbi:MAG: aminotransferase class V-fold PLP-dependent enzyme [Mycoplasmoidaceae bacterium]